MTAKKEEAADDLEWGTLEGNEQQKNLIKQVKEKSIYDFLRNNGSPRRRAHNYLTDGMKYVTSQMLDEANEILDRELKEFTWEDEMEWKEYNLLYDYNLAEVIVAEEVKAAELIPE